MHTLVYVAGASEPLIFPGSIAEFRQLQPDAAGTLRWDAQQHGRVLVDQNVAPVVALRELGQLMPGCLCTNLGGDVTAACPVHGPDVAGIPA